MRATLNGVILAESAETLLIEGNHYFPPDSVVWGHFQERQLRSPCFWKGIARYYDVHAGGRREKAAAWTYHHPFPWIRKIRDHVAFWGAVEITG